LQNKAIVHQIGHCLSLYEDVRSANHKNKKTDDTSLTSSDSRNLEFRKIWNFKFKISYV